MRNCRPAVAQGGADLVEADQLDMANAFQAGAGGRGDLGRSVRTRNCFASPGVAMTEVIRMISWTPSARRMGQLGRCRGRRGAAV